MDSTHFGFLLVDSCPSPRFWCVLDFEFGVNNYTLEVYEPNGTKVSGHCIHYNIFEKEHFFRRTYSMLIAYHSRPCPEKPLVCKINTRYNYRFLYFTDNYAKGHSQEEGEEHLWEMVVPQVTIIDFLTKLPPTLLKDIVDIQVCYGDNNIVTTKRFSVPCFPYGEKGDFTMKNHNAIVGSMSFLFLTGQNEPAPKLPRTIVDMLADDLINTSNMSNTQYVRDNCP